MSLLAVAQQLGYIVLAMTLGAIVGIDRELADKPAGLRTHMLVAGAAAMFVLLGRIAAQQFYQELSNGAVRADPIRIIEAVVTGVSFLGAGTILRHRTEEQVEGLTTAASILLTAAVGVAVALGQVLLAVGVTIIAILTLRGLGYIDELLPTERDADRGENEAASDETTED